MQMYTHLYECGVSVLLQVTVFQEVRNPGEPDSFKFTVDGSLRNMTAYITGTSSLTFNLTSPTGVVITSNSTNSFAPSSACH